MVFFHVAEAFVAIYFEASRVGAAFIMKEGEVGMS